MDVGLPQTARAGGRDLLSPDASCRASVGWLADPVRPKEAERRAFLPRPSREPAQGSARLGWSVPQKSPDLISRAVFAVQIKAEYLCDLIEYLVIVDELVQIAVYLSAFVASE